jgi:hypothetical protein
VREQGEKLVFGRVRADQLLTQGDVPRFVFHEVEHALDGLSRALETEEVYVHKSGQAALIRKGLLHQLKGRSEREHLLDRSSWSDLHFIVFGLVNVLFLG